MARPGRNGDVPALKGLGATQLYRNQPQGRCHDLWSLDWPGQTRAMRRDQQPIALVAAEASGVTKREGSVGAQDVECPDPAIIVSLLL